MQILRRSLWLPKSLPRYGQCQASNLACRKAHPLIICSTRLTARGSPTSFTRRQWTTSPILLPPLVFAGLLVTLWTYKCLMLVVFQNKIIYMPSVPPFSRSEKIEDYAAQCHPVIWQEVRTKAADGTEIALAIGEIDAAQQKSVMEKDHAASTKDQRKHIFIIYFHGSVTSSPWLHY